MNVVFRVDASVQIGIGHLMRCLTLADGLRAQGAKIYFICRDNEGNLTDFVTQKNYPVFVLKTGVVAERASGGFRTSQPESSALMHASWLTVSQQEDAKACLPFLKNIKPDWLIVDHYAIDYQWQRLLKSCYQQLMVIDDLADRQHECDLLLDQTYRRSTDAYRRLVSANCKLLLGSQYALLRPEFVQWRDQSRKRRRQPELKKLLITLGGIDAENITSQILVALRECVLPADLSITVVMGATAPHLAVVRQLAGAMPNITQVKVNVQNMAELMTQSDLAIGAAGATTWERCCLALPTISIMLADNQRMVVELLEKEKLTWVIKRESLGADLKKLFSSLTIEGLTEISDKASHVVDGLGLNRVIKEFNQRVA